MSSNPHILALAVASVLFTGCEPVEAPSEDADPEAEGAALSALACAWDPVFGLEHCYQSDWWLEFSVQDATAISMVVEVSDPAGVRVVPLSHRVPLSGGHVKFTGGPTGGPVPAGTLVRLRVAQSAEAGGNMARTAWFPYRMAAPIVECEGCTPSCAPGTCGGDGCGGTCACPSGAVCMPDQTCCQPNSDPCGPDGCGGTHGACPCDPSCDGKQCGDDGCGGTCGTCDAGTMCDGGTCAGGCVAPWSPFWQQTSAGAWWVEYKVAGGGSLPQSVSFEVIGGATTSLNYSHGRWARGLPKAVPSGTWAILHATDVTGATAQTVPFQYLVDQQPLTDPCMGTPSTSPGCVPLARGMVTFTMDDSYTSQATLALPVLAQYGFKATIYHITRNLQDYGRLPWAELLAAAGHEVASHSRTHPYLPNLTAQGIDDELRLSKEYLLANVSSSVESFASPMGAYDSSVLAAVKTYYTSHRTVNPGLNYVGSDVYQLNADGVYNTSSVSSVCADLATTAAYRGWRILVFHNFVGTETSSSSLSYPIADFDGILQCAQTTPGLDVVTTREGVAAIACATP